MNEWATNILELHFQSSVIVFPSLIYKKSPNIFRQQLIAQSANDFVLHKC